MEEISLQHFSYPQFTILDTDGSKIRRNHAWPGRHHSTSQRQAAGRQFDRMWRQFCWMIEIQNKCRADQSDPRRTLDDPGPITESIVFAWMFLILGGPGHKKVFVYATNLNFEENGRRVELRGNFQTPIFAFTEEKHTFLKRLMERRSTKEYSTIWTAHLVIINDMLIWGIRTVLVHMWQAMVLVSFWFPDTNFLCF